jgi:hypothetical protein
MPKKSKKRPRATKIDDEPKSNASVYAEKLARQVATEMSPARTPRKGKVTR